MSSFLLGALLCPIECEVEGVQRREDVVHPLSFGLRWSLDSVSQQASKEPIKLKRLITLHLRFVFPVASCARKERKETSNKIQSVAMSLVARCSWATMLASYSHYIPSALKLFI